MLQRSSRATGFIEPAGADWLHEIKHSQRVHPVA
jgi:hypothetical protein